MVPTAIGADLVWTNDASNISAVYNRNSSTWFESAKQAVAAASADDTLLIGGASFDVPGIIDARDLPLTFEARSDVTITDDLMFLPGNGSSFISLDGDALNTYASRGRIIAPENGQLIFNDLEFLDGSQFQQNGSSLLVNGQLATTGGVTYLSGEALAVGISTGINGVNRVADDTDIYGDYTNAGATIIQRGILYIYGDLVNTGTLTGEYNNGFAGGSTPEPGDGFSIGGSYTVGQDATLSMPNPVWWLRVGGDLDIAVDDPADFTMSEATIELNGLAPGNLQTMETLSADLGADEAGFDPSNFPIGTLRITSDSRTQLVNNHVNSTDTPCEVLYVDELVVASGGTLITNGCRVYARTAMIDGTVDDPDAIVIVEDTPDCLGDIDGNSVVNGVDLAFVLGAWASSDAAADVSGDGTVDGMDLAIVLGAWGICP